MRKTVQCLTLSMMPYSLACHGSKYLGRWMSFAIFSGSLLVCRASSDTCARHRCLFRPVVEDSLPHGARLLGVGDRGL